MSFADLCVEILEARMWDDATPAERASPLTLVRARRALLAWARRRAGVVRLPAFALREVDRHGAARARQRARSSKRSIRDELAGTFFTMDLDRARARARAAAVGARRRAAPALAATGSRSTIDEHVPLARWNDSALVNTHGEVFVADYDGELPQFAGPDGASAEMAARYREWSAALAPLALTLRARARCRRAAAGRSRARGTAGR